MYLPLNTMAHTPTIRRRTIQFNKVKRQQDFLSRLWGSLLALTFFRMTWFEPMKGQLYSVTVWTRIVWIFPETWSARTCLRFYRLSFQTAISNITESDTMPFGKELYIYFAPRTIRFQALSDGTHPSCHRFTYGSYCHRKTYYCPLSPRRPCPKDNDNEQPLTVDYSIWTYCIIFIFLFILFRTRRMIVCVCVPEAYAHRTELAGFLARARLLGCARGLARVTRDVCTTNLVRAEQIITHSWRCSPLSRNRKFNADYTYSSGTFRTVSTDCSCTQNWSLS